MKDHLRSVLIDQRWNLRTFEAYGLIDYELLDIQNHDRVVMHGAIGSGACAIDSDETLRSALAFITLREGDVDELYFDNYSQAELDWRDEHAEHLSQWADRELALPWEDLDDED